MGFFVKLHKTRARLLILRAQEKSGQTRMGIVCGRCRQVHTHLLHVSESPALPTYWQLLNFNETTCDCQLYPPLLYSCVYQKVQSSLGSTLIEL